MLYIYVMQAIVNNVYKVYFNSVITKSNVGRKKPCYSIIQWGHTHFRNSGRNGLKQQGDVLNFLNSFELSEMLRDNVHKFVSWELLFRIVLLNKLKHYSETRPITWFKPFSITFVLALKHVSVQNFINMSWKLRSGQTRLSSGQTDKPVYIYLEKVFLPRRV